MQELQCKTFQIWSNLENLVGAVLIYIYKVKKNAEISNNVCVIQITRKSMCTEVTKQISFRKFVWMIIEVILFDKIAFIMFTLMI